MVSNRDPLPHPGTLEVAYKDDVAIVRLLGEHDLATRPDLKRELTSLIDKHTGVVVDLRDTDFLDASILNVLISANHELTEKRQTRLALLVKTECRVQRALDVSGLLTILPCGRTTSRAVRLAHDRID